MKEVKVLTLLTRGMGQKGHSNGGEQHVQRPEASKGHDVWGTVRHAEERAQDGPGQVGDRARWYFGHRCKRQCEERFDTEWHWGCAVSGLFQTQAPDQTPCCQATACRAVLL